MVSNKVFPVTSLCRSPWTVYRIMAGYGQTAVLTDGGDICMWGHNSHGQLGDASTSNRSTPVLISPIIGPRSGDPGKRVIKLVHTSTVIDTANSWYALCEDGTVWAWGNNGYGQLAQGNTENSSVPVQIQQVGGIPVTNAVDIAAAGGQYGHVLVLTSDNEILACGHSQNYKTGLSTTANTVLLTPATGIPMGAVRKIMCGGHDATGMSGVLMEDGRLYLAGHNGQGALGQGNTSILPGFNQVVTAIGANVQDCWILASNQPQVFASLNDGSLYAWGNGNGGGLGLGSTANQTTPQQVIIDGDNTPNVSRMASGGTHTSAYYQTSILLTADKRAFTAGVYAYGGGPFNQSNVFREWLVPCKTASFEDIEGAQFSNEAAQFVLDSDGSVFAAGRNTNGKLRIGHTSHSAVPQRVRF